MELYTPLRGTEWFLVASECKWVLVCQSVFPSISLSPILYFSVSVRLTLSHPVSLRLSLSPSYPLSLFVPLILVSVSLSMTVCHPLHVLCLSVCLSLAFWNSANISRPSLFKRKATFWSVVSSITLSLRGFASSISIHICSAIDNTLGTHNVSG